MDAATLQAKVYAGYGKAALRIGYVFDRYRPSSAFNPTAPGNLAESLRASFTAGPAGHNFEKASSYKSQLYLGLFDARNAAPGDYLVSGAWGTFFIASMAPVLPIFCVGCNRVMSAARAPVQTGIGALPYNGETPGNEVAVMTAWPASVLYTQKGRSAEVGLPMDLPSPFFEILMPDYPGVTLRSGDVLTDDLGQRYVVSAAELTELGWRLSTQMAET